jgi:hypothetical protein
MPPPDTQTCVHYPVRGHFPPRQSRKGRKYPSILQRRKAALAGGKRFTNNAQGFTTLIAWLGERRIERVVFEPTGAYHHNFERRLGHPDAFDAR